MKLNNTTNERILCRHSSMVLKEYRGKGIYSDLLNVVKKKFQKTLDLLLCGQTKIITQILVLIKIV